MFMSISATPARVTIAFWGLNGGRNLSALATDGLRTTDSIAVITVNWNGAGITLRCYDALRASQDASWHLYIIDNASTDGSAERLEEALSGRTDVSVIRSPVNAGWTGGNNRGIVRALSDGAEFLFLLNNDAFVRPDTLARLVATFRDNAAVMPVLGPIQCGEYSSQYDFRASHREPTTGIPMWTAPDDLEAEASLESGSATWPTAYISGAGLLVHRHHLERVGLLDERFFLNFDDADWCARAEAAGFPLLMVRDAIIDHIGSASIGGRESPLQTYFMTRNRLLYAEKHRPLIDRLHLARRQWWQARNLTGGSPTRILLSQADPVLHSFRQGLIDYAARRFGDCPPSVIAAQARARQV